MKHVTVYPFIWHSIAMSLFASVIGPFGGFFASGFKRAFKIKVRPKSSAYLSTTSVMIYLVRMNYLSFFQDDFFCIVGFCRTNSWSRRRHGPLWLSGSDGMFCQRVHSILHPTGKPSQALQSSYAYGSSRPADIVQLAKELSRTEWSPTRRTRRRHSGSATCYYLIAAKNSRKI